MKFSSVSCDFTILSLTLRERKFRISSFLEILLNLIISLADILSYFKRKLILALYFKVSYSTLKRSIVSAVCSFAAFSDYIVDFGSRRFFKERAFCN